MKTWNGGAASGLIVTAIGLGVVGCSGPENQQWTSKQESSMSEGSPGLSASAEPIALAVTSNAREAAFDLLNQASTSREALIRANAIEGLTWAFPEGMEQRDEPHFKVMEDAVRRGLGDANRGVRFVSTMAVGRMKLTSLAPLVDPLRMDDSQSVQAAALYALKRCGKPVDLAPLAKMLMTDDPEIRGNAAFVLGEIGEKSAAGLLRSALGKVMERTNPMRGKIVDMQIAEALVKLGDTHQLELIRAAVYSTAQDSELAALACQMCGELKDGRWAPNLWNVATQGDEREISPEVRIAATGALAKIGDTQVPVEIAMSYANSEKAGLRAQAAATLGLIGDPKLALRIQQMMSDSHPGVQVAAAGAMLRLPTQG